MEFFNFSGVEGSVFSHPKNRLRIGHLSAENFFSLHTNTLTFPRADTPLHLLLLTISTVLLLVALLNHFSILQQLELVSRGLSGSVPYSLTFLLIESHVGHRWKSVGWHELKKLDVNFGLTANLVEQYFFTSRKLKDCGLYNKTLRIPFSQKRIKLR